MVMLDVISSQFLMIGIRLTSENAVGLGGVIGGGVIVERFLIGGGGSVFPWRVALAFDCLLKLIGSGTAGTWGYS